MVRRSRLFGVIASEVSESTIDVTPQVQFLQLSLSLFSNFYLIFKIFMYVS